MAPKPTQKKQPFVIEPLNWTTKDVSRDEPAKRNEDAKQPAPAKESRD